MKVRSILTMTLCGVLIFGLLMPAGAQMLAPQAFPSAGLHCFQLTPFIDIIRLDVRRPDPDEPFFLYSVDWDGIDSYHVLGGGTAVGTTTSPMIGLHFVASHLTDSFGGNRVCSLQAAIDPVFLTGPYSFDCQGSVPFANSGPDFFFVPTPCEEVVAVAKSLQAQGRSRAGDQP